MESARKISEPKLGQPESSPFVASATWAGLIGAGAGNNCVRSFKEMYASTGLSSEVPFFWSKHQPCISYSITPPSRAPAECAVVCCENRLVIFGAKTGSPHLANRQGVSESFTVSWPPPAQHTPFRGTVGLNLKPPIHFRFF